MIVRAGALDAGFRSARWNTIEGSEKAMAKADGISLSERSMDLRAVALNAGLSSTMGTSS